MNKSFQLDSPFWLFWKKHFCPDCGQMLTVKKVKKVVNSKSPEAKDFDFSCGDSYFFGDVEFSYYMLHCDSCDKFYSIKEIRGKERELKKLGRKK